MTLIQFLRILSRHSRLIVLTGIVTALVVFLLVDDSKKSFTTGSRVYTGFASGFSITGENRKDYYTVKTQFDNFFETVHSRSTLEEIALRTLAYYLSQKTLDDRDLMPEHQALISETFEGVEMGEYIKKGNPKLTFELLKEQYYSSFENTIYLALNDRNSPLKELISLEIVSAIEVNQEGTSDLVNMSFTAIDPGLAYRVMEYGLTVILSRAKDIKSDESNNVVKYFEEEVKKAQQRLNLAEAELSALMTANNITNYYEQTKWLASRNEDFEVAFQKEKLGLAAAEAAEKQADISMGLSNGIKVKSAKIVSIRKKIRGLNEEMARINLEVDPRFVPSIIDSTEKEATEPAKGEAEVTKVMQEIAAAENELKEELAEFLKMKHTSTGIQMKDVATKWLESAIQVEEFKARIMQFVQFEKEFEITYSRFARLGSKIKQLERKIAVHEKDYLDLLASLNDARLMEENLQLTSNFKIVDQPFYPVNAEKSKKLLLVILGLIGGMVIVVFILLTLEFLDNSIKSPERLEELSGLPAVGGMTLKKEKQDEYDLLLEHKLINQISTYINLCFHQQEVPLQPFIILLFSTRKAEGKSTLIKQLADALSSHAENTICFQPSSQELMISEQSSKSDGLVHPYAIPTNFFDTTVEEIAASARTVLVDQRFIIIEIPGIVGSDLPIKLIQKAHMSLMVCKANRVWNRADQRALEEYKEIATSPIKTIINGAMADELEGVIGEVPKRRSKFRRIIKRIASFQFEQKKF